MGETVLAGGGVIECEGEASTDGNIVDVRARLEGKLKR